MNILQINAIYGEKSTGTIMVDIGLLIESEGNNAYYAYQQARCFVKNGYKVGNPLDWKIHALLSRLFGGQGFYSSFATKKLIRQIEKNGIDVVHMHNLHSNYVNIDMLLEYIAAKNIATVITMHDCWWFTGKCFHYVDCDCSKFQSGCGKCPKRYAAPRSILCDTSARYWEKKKKRLLAIPRLKVIGCSEWICNEAKKSFLKECDIKSIYNGVDIKIFRPYDTTELEIQLNIQDEFIILGMADKWMQPSNINLINEIKKLDNVKIMIVGCTENQIKALSAYGDSVIPIGFIHDRVELAKYYNVADVFVNLTHADTLPTVNMESICCGTPVITYDSCGSPELVDVDTGIVVEENDQDSIIQAIISARQKKWDKCANVGRSKFDKNECYKEYSVVYKKLLE